MTAPDPKKRTSAPPQVVEGVTFRCYRVGVGRYAWISDDGRLYVRRNLTGTRSTYGAVVDEFAVPGENPLHPKRFTSLGSAMRGAVLDSRKDAMGKRIK